MHIHGAAMNNYAIGFNSAKQTDKTAAAQRAAETRRKLLKSAQSIDGSMDSTEGLLIGQWLDSRHSQVQSEDQYHTVVSGKDPDVG